MEGKNLMVQPSLVEAETRTVNFLLLYMLLTYSYQLDMIAQHGEQGPTTSSVIVNRCLAWAYLCFIYKKFV